MRRLADIGWLLLAMPFPFLTTGLIGSWRALAINLIVLLGGFGVMFGVAAGPGIAMALLAIPHAWWTVLTRART